MGTIDYRDSSLLATVAANGIMSAADKAKLASLQILDGYATISSLNIEIARAEAAEQEIRVAIDGYGNSSIDGYVLDGYATITYLNNALNSALDGYATVSYVDGYACSNTDPRLSNSRIPTAHATTHIVGGSDSIDGYRILITYTPTNYLAPLDGYIGEHIARIDQKLGQSSGSITAILSDGYSGSFDEIKTPPGCTLTTGTLKIWNGGQSITDTSLSTNASTSLLVQSLLSYGLGNNKIYNCTLGFRCIMWATADKSNSGSMDSVVDLYITTDGYGNVSVVVQTTPLIDKSRLNSVVGPATMTLVASTNGFTISAARPADLACAARTRWWINSFEDITS